MLPPRARRTDRSLVQLALGAWPYLWHGPL